MLLKEAKPEKRWLRVELSFSSRVEVIYKKKTRKSVSSDLQIPRSGLYKGSPAECVCACVLLPTNTRLGVLGSQIINNPAEIQS